MAHLPILSAASRLTRPDQPNYPLQLRSGILYWLELTQARVLYLPGAEEPSGIVGPYSNDLPFPYGGLPRFSEELLAAMLQLPEPPEVIGLLAPPRHEPYRYFLTEQARFRIVRITQYSAHEDGMTDCPLTPPESWLAPNRQPGLDPCAQCLAAARRELQPLETRERIERRHLDQFRNGPKPNKGIGAEVAVKTRQLNKSRRDLEHTLAENDRRAAEQAENFRREAECWSTRAALPDNPEPWRRFLRERILPGLQASLLRLAYHPERSRPPYALHPIRLEEDPAEDRINVLTQELLLWEKELAALPPEAKPPRPAVLYGPPLPKPANTAKAAASVPARSSRQPSRPNRPNLTGSNSYVLETIAHSDRLERAINIGRRDPEALLRELDTELLPGIIRRELAALRQLAVDRHIDHAAARRDRPANPAANPDNSDGIPGSGFLRPARYWKSLQKDEARFRQYWTARRPELLAQARARREQQDCQWPPPALAAQSPALDPDRNPALHHLAAGRLLFPAPGGPSDYWYYAGLELRPDPEPKSARSPEPTAYLLRDRDTNQVLGRFRREKETGCHAGRNWNHYNSRNTLTGTAQSPEILWEQAVAGAVATAARLRSRRQLNRLQLLNHSQQEILDLLGLGITPPADPAAALLRGGNDYRELRRLEDGQVLWQLTQRENPINEYYRRQLPCSWLGAPAPANSRRATPLTAWKPS